MGLTACRPWLRWTRRGPIRKLELGRPCSTPRAQLSGSGLAPTTTAPTGSPSPPSCSHLALERGYGPVGLLLWLIFGPPSISDQPLPTAL